MKIVNNSELHSISGGVISFKPIDNGVEFKFYHSFFGYGDDSVEYKGFKLGGYAAVYDGKSVCSGQVVNGYRIDISNPINSCLYKTYKITNV